MQSHNFYFWYISVNNKTELQSLFQNIFPLFRHTSLSVKFMLYHSHHFLFDVFPHSHKKRVISHSFHRSRKRIETKNGTKMRQTTTKKPIIIHKTISHTCKNAFPSKNSQKMSFWHFSLQFGHFWENYLVPLYFSIKQDTTADSVLHSADSDKERLFWPPMEQSKVRKLRIFWCFGHPIFFGILGRWT